MGKFDEVYQNYLKLQELGLVEKFPETEIGLVSQFLADCPQPLLAPEPEPAGLLPETDAVTTDNNEDEVWVEPWEFFKETYKFPPQDANGLFNRVFDVYQEKTNGASPKLRPMGPTNYKADSSQLSMYLYPKAILMEIFRELKKSHPKHFEIKNIGSKTS